MTMRLVLFKHFNSKLTSRLLQLKTNIKTSELMGFENGKKFILADKGKKIIGFHGKSLGFMDMLRRTSTLLENISKLFLLLNRNAMVVLEAYVGMMVCSSAYKRCMFVVIVFM